MALYFVSYDLRGQNRNYPKLYEKLESLGAVQVLESTYCLERDNTTVKKIRNYLCRFIDDDDGVCVTEVTDWATYSTYSSPDDL